MLRNAVRATISNPVFVNLLMVFVLLGGLGGGGMMVRELLPSFEMEMVTIQIPYPGANPEEVEEGVTLKVEEAIEGLDGIKRYMSSSFEGMMSATIEVRQNYDVQVLKDKIESRVDAITSFPDDTEEPIITALEIARETLNIAVTGDVPERQLHELAEDVKDELLALPEVSQVSIKGERAYEISIEVSEETLRRYGLTFEDIRQAVAQGSTNVPGGDVLGDQEEIKIRTLGRRYTGSEYEDIIVVTREDGTLLTLGDIATIRDEFVEDQVSSRFVSTKGESHPSITLSISVSESEDALVVAKAVREYVQTRNDSLPPTVRLIPWQDNSVFITQRIDLLLWDGLLGLLLVFALLWLLLDFRLAWWVSYGIPVSLAGTLFIMFLFGGTLNMISLFAMIMVIGIIVDDAIVVGEAIYIHRRQGKGPFEAAVEGTAEVAMPVITGVLTTCVAFVPLLFIKGIMGDFIFEIPFVVIVALLVSLVETLVMLPVHLRHLPDLSGNDKPRGGKLTFPQRTRQRIAAGLEGFVERVYRPFIAASLSWRYTSLAAIFAVLLVTIGLMRGGLAEFIFFPDIDSPAIGAKVEFPEGTPLSVTKEAVVRLEEGLLRVVNSVKTESGRPMVLSLESNIGAAFGLEGGFAESFQGDHIGELRAEMLDSEERGKHLYFREVLRMWEEEVGPLAGAISVSYYGASSGPPGKPVEVWLLGKDYRELQAASEELKTQLRQTDGVYQVDDDFRPGKRELRARIRPEAEALGLTNADLARQLRRGYYGEEVLRVQRGRDEVKVWIRYPRSERGALDDLEQIRIQTPNGHEVPLKSVATLELVDGYTTIRRKDGVRRIAVTAEVETDRVTPDEVLSALFQPGGFMAQLTANHPGVTVTLEGRQREQIDAFSSLKIGFPLAIVGIYLVIATLFRSYVQPLVIMTTVPFGIIGSVIGHVLLGYQITMMSMFGLVALTGVVVNDAIIMIEAVNDRLAAGFRLDEALVDGGCRRFRPILLISVTTVVGMFPLVTEQSMQAQFLIPMAIAIATGVAFSTVLTLVVVPCLIYILNDLRRLTFWFFRGYWPTREEVEPAAHRGGHVPGETATTPPSREVLA